MFETARFTDSYRRDTEDRAAILTPTPQSMVLVVADGVGGRVGGGAAADGTMQRVREAISTLKVGDAMAWHRLALQIDSALAEDAEAGETTLAIVSVTPKRIVGVSVGDSEAWWVTPGGHFDLTEAQIAKPFLGSGAARPMPFTLPTPRSGTLLMATDGLFKYARPEAIQETALLPDLDEAARRVADLARTPAGRLPDDLAVLLCRVSLPDTPTLVGRLRGWFRR